MSIESTNFFVGEFRHKLDAKNRLTIPSDWRFEADGRSVYLAIPDPNGCISVFPPAIVQKIIDAASQPHLSSPEIQRVLSKLGRLSSKISCDKAGRISLDTRLLEHAGINGDAVLTGQFTKFQIWSAERLSSEDSKLESSSDVSETLAALGL